MVIISAVDGPEDASIVEQGEALATAFNDDLHVVHVLSRDEIEDSTGVEGGDVTALERAEKRAAEIAEEVTDEFVAVGRIGRPAKELEDYVESIEGRYLVVGGRRRTPIGKALFGSVSQSVLLNVDIPVVTVRGASQ
jgi:nucleotide-binding universal stress UspA family protein